MRDLLQSTGRGSSPLRLAAYSCHCPIAACSHLLSGVPSGSCCHADSRPGYQRWLQVLEGCDVCMKKKWWELSVPNTSPLSLRLLLGLLLPLLLPEVELPPMVTLSGQRNMQKAGELRIQKDCRSRRLEGLLPTQSTPPTYTSSVKCLSLTVLAMPLSAEVCLHQWSSCASQLFHEEWQNTMQKGNCFAIWGFQGICLPSFTSWCPSGSVGILTPFTMWLLVIRILIHS